MKARLKGESEWKDYKMVFNSDGVFLGLETAGYYEGDNEKEEIEVRDTSGDVIVRSKSRRYVSEILPLECFDLWSEPDWDAYRREAAKAILAGIATYSVAARTISATVGIAIDYADELIRRLKEEEQV